MFKVVRHIGESDADAVRFYVSLVRRQGFYDGVVVAIIVWRLLALFPIVLRSSVSCSTAEQDVKPFLYVTVDNGE